MLISIHAPARGATKMPNLNSGYHWISIHAPARGATPLQPQLWGNFRISIHAPARGATRMPCRSQTLHGFQSTLPRGERRDATSGSLRVLDEFQSTLPRGERRCHAPFLPTSITHFNPRSREGSDKTRFKPPFEKRISIHAPARGATGIGGTACERRVISIHAPARGATAFIDIFSFTVRLYFISSHQ